MRTSSLLAVLILAGCATTGGKDTAGEDGVANQKPVAEAGEAINQTADSAVALSGAASTDPDGNVPLLYHWSFDHLPEGSTLASRESAFTANHTEASVSTTFSPDVVGTYVVKLTVTDAKGKESDPDYVIVTVEDAETVPVANAGSDVTTNVGELVNLDGSRSYDPMYRTLTYSWTVVDKPETSAVETVTGSDSALASFTPDVKGVYVLNLVVDNGLSRSASDAVTVTAVDDDASPVANAGADQEVEDCSTVQLDCSASADPDGDTLSYSWELQSKPSGSSITSASLSDRTSARPTFYPDVAGDYVFTCSVNDGSNWSSPDLVTIEAAERRANERPTITAGTDLTISGGSATCEESGYSYECDECAAVTSTLGSTATVTDVDGDPLTIMWSTDNSSATIADQSSLVTTVTLEDAEPTEPGECEDTEYEFELTVSDCTGATVTDRVTFTVNCCGVEDTSAR